MLKKIFRSIKITRQKNRIKRCAQLGNDVTFSTSSFCVNTGPKENVRIGNHCCFRGGIQALFGGKVRIGNNLFFGSGSCIQAKEQVVIGDNVIIASNVLIVDNNNHPVSPPKREEMSMCEDYMTDPLWTWEYACSKPIIIEDNVWIGRDSRILKGVTVGRGSIVALGAIVTKDVPAYTVVAGNPAVVVKDLSE